MDVNQVQWLSIIGQPMIITKVAVYHPNCDGQCDYQV
jgi:hypothetical protein